MDKARLFNRNWVYHDSDMSRKPGYLARKFAHIRHMQKEEKEKQAKVLPLKREAK